MSQTKTVIEKHVRNKIINKSDLTSIHSKETQYDNRGQQNGLVQCLLIHLLISGEEFHTKIFLYNLGLKDEKKRV